jgi:phosphoglucomutase
MAVAATAGTHPTPDQLIDPARLERDYYANHPDPGNPVQQVKFGTSGHRGTTAAGTFTEAHILAISQAICDYRASQGIAGPLYVGKDTHALSGPAQRTALEVFAANRIEAYIQREDGYTPTPVISHTILGWNRAHAAGPAADGVVITPSHNPPTDGGIKYNPPNGGPADTDITGWMEERANQLLAAGNRDVRRVSYEKASHARTTHLHDFVDAYVRDLAAVIDMDAIRGANLRLGADPLGGASVMYWAPIADRYQITIDLVNPVIDPTFGFMTLDHDGRIRMDCSSPYAMAGLVKLKNRYSIAFGNDPDADRHGIVTPTSGLMNPNHFLAAAIRYLLPHRPQWPAASRVGKTLVSSGIIDRVTTSLGRAVAEVPVGFKWFAPGLYDGSIVFGGEESAGACFLRRDATVWTTDKDGIIMDLLAAEMLAVTGKDPGEHYREIEADFGTSYYTRIDAAATPEQKALLKRLSPESVAATEMAGEQIVAKLTEAPANGASIEGLKVVTANGWFAARPSGTENIYKVYAESFRSTAHLEQIVAEARRIVSETLAAGGA